MRVFVLLRSLFFVVLLTAITIFVMHKQLCINYTPHNLEGLMENCKESLDSIAQVQSVQADPLIFGQNETDIEVTFAEEDHILSKRSTDEAVNVTEIDANFTMIAEWHKLHLKNDVVRLNVRTCFNFTIHEIFGTSIQKYTNIVNPLRLTIILIITSFLLGVLDLSSRVILHTVSLVQCLAHSFAQVVLWGYILVNIEVYRRSWIKMWLEAGQTSTEIPMYPSGWLAFELHAFIIMMLSILDAVLFKYLPRRIRLLNSQGVYKCIQPETKLYN